MHIRAPPAAALLRYKQACRDVGDDDNDGDSESDDDVSCTVTDDIVGFNNKRPFWGKCYQSRVDTLGIYNDDSDDDDDDDDDWRAQVVDSYINNAQEQFLSSSVEQTASLTESDGSSGESFGDGSNAPDMIGPNFHQPQQNVATGDPIADTMTRIMNAGMGISTSYESIQILPIITEQQQMRDQVAINIPVPDITEQQKRKAIIAVITGQQQQQQQSNNNVSSSSSSSIPLKKRQRQELVQQQQQHQQQLQEGGEKDQQQLQHLPVASLTIYPDTKQTESALQQEQNNNMNKKKPPPSSKSPKDSMLFDDVKWNSRLIEATKFVVEHKHGRIPTSYTTNPDLGSWAKRQRYQYKVFMKQQKQNSKDEVNKRGKLIKEIRCQMTPERLIALDDIGFCWDLQKGLWDSRYEELRLYANSNNGNASPSKYDHYELWKWVGTQRFQMTLWRRGKTTYLTPERIYKLNEIGFVWDYDNPHAAGLASGIPKRGTMPENDSQGPYFI